MHHKDLRLVNKAGRVELRKRAVRAVLEASDRSISRIAKLMGVRWHTLNTWVEQCKAGGEKALEVDNRGAEKWDNTILTEKENKMIYKMIINKTPDQLQMNFMLWTRQAIQELIKLKFNKEISLQAISVMLKKWNMTFQKPKLKSYKQNPAVVEKWLNESYPAIVAAAKKENAMILWGDETSICSGDVVGKGFATKGQTPVLKTPGSRYSIKMVSCVSNRGEVRFMTFKGSMNAKMFIEFLRRLTKGQTKKIYLIIDNSRVHHAKLIREWVAKHSDEIQLKFLPPYSPEHNPDEYLNQTIKARLKIRRKDQNAAELQNSVTQVMGSLQKSPKIIQSLFNHPLVRYAS